MIRLTHLNIEEFKFVSGEHSEVANAGLSEKRITINQKFGNGMVRDCLFENMHFMEMDLSLNQKTEIAFSTDSPVLELQFNLEGAYSHPNSKIDTNMLPTLPYTHNILFYPPQSNDFIHRVNTQKSKTLEIHITQTYFQSLMQGDFPYAENFLTKMQQVEFAGISRQHMVITSSMSSVINDLLNCNKTGLLKKLFYESKILELLMLQLEQLHTVSKRKSDLSRKDIEQLQEARWIVENNLHTPYSLPELARKVGTNEFKLKKGFKQLFGVPVFAYIIDRRMERSKQLLLEGNLSITEIAELAGYKYANHFSAAFKKKFGMLPGQVKAKNFKK